MECPKCEHAMETLSYGAGDREVERCTNCFGLWLKPHDLTRLKNTYRADLLDEGKPAIGKEYNKIEDIDCPVCGTRMEKTHDEDQVHIWFEACPQGHGLFLDAGELKDYNNETFMDIVKGWFTGKRDD